MEDLEYLVNVPVTSRQLNDLFASSWEGHQWRDFEPVLRLSLGYICAFRGDELLGFVNLAWDGESTHSSWISPCTRTCVVATLGVGW
jgi:hypothetical protein